MLLQVAAQVIGNDTAITIGGMQGNFQLNVRVPLIARYLLGLMHILSAVTTLFAEQCVAGIVANTDRLSWLADNTPASATALTPVVGYDIAGEIVRRAESDEVSSRNAARESPRRRTDRQRAEPTANRPRQPDRMTDDRSTRQLDPGRAVLFRR